MAEIEKLKRWEYDWQERHSVCWEASHKLTGQLAIRKCLLCGWIIPLPSCVSFAQNLRAWSREVLLLFQFTWFYAHVLSLTHSSEVWPCPERHMRAIRAAASWSLTVAPLLVHGQNWALWGRSHTQTASSDSLLHKWNCSPSTLLDTNLCMRPLGGLHPW